MLQEQKAFPDGRAALLIFTFVSEYELRLSALFYVSEEKTSSSDSTPGTFSSSCKTMVVTCIGDSYEQRKIEGKWNFETQILQSSPKGRKNVP